MLMGNFRKIFFTVFSWSNFNKELKFLRGDHLKVYLLITQFANTTLPKVFEISRSVTFEVEVLSSLKRYQQNSFKYILSFL